MFKIYFCSVILFIIIAIEQVTTSTSNYVQKDGYICLSCPLVREGDGSIVNLWTAQIGSSAKSICMNQVNVKQEFKKNRPDEKFLFSCKLNQLCMYQYKSYYPTSFECMVGSGYSAINLTYLGKF